MKRFNALCIVLMGITGLVYGSEQKSDAPDSPRTAVLKSALAVIQDQPLTAKHRDLVAKIQTATPADDAKRKKAKSTKKESKENKAGKPASSGEQLFYSLMQQQAVECLIFFEPIRESSPALYDALVTSKMQEAACMLAPLLKTDKE